MRRTLTITSDWHIHSEHSCDQACLPVATLVSEAAAKGITDYGLTDHIHTPFNLPDLQASRADFDRQPANPRFHFGVEVSCVSQWEIDEYSRTAGDFPVYGLRKGGEPGCAMAIGLTAQHLTELGLEYVVGGTHWPLYVELERDAVIRDYHRQNMFLACHPLVDIVAHPWWWHGHWRGEDGRFTAEPWFDDFGHIPASLHAEFVAAARQHGKKIEINPGATFLNQAYSERFQEQYLEYLGGLKAAGATLSYGSDCHSDHYNPDLDLIQAKLATVGITCKLS